MKTPSGKGASAPSTEAKFRQWANREIAAFKRREKEQDGGDPRAFRTRWKFLSAYFGYLTMPGPTIESRVRVVERFIKLQSGDEPGARYRLRLISPGFGLDTELLVERIDEVDLSDIHDIIDLDVLEIAKVDGSGWSKREADAVYRAVMADFDYDGVTPVLRREIFDEFLMLRGNWDGEEEDDE